MKQKIKDLAILIIFCIVVLVFVSGYALYAFEKDVNGDISSYWDGVWLAAVTASSVGYGDVYPVSAEGKVLSSILGFTGLLLIGATSALFTAYIIRFRSVKEK